MNFSNELVEVIKGSAIAEYEFSASATDCARGAQLELEHDIADVIHEILDKVENAAGYNGPGFAKNDTKTPLKRCAMKFLALVLDELSTGSLIDTEWCTQQFIREGK